jgi:hypothetical protein
MRQEKKMAKICVSVLCQKGLLERETSGKGMI